MRRLVPFALAFTTLASCWMAACGSSADAPSGDDIDGKGANGAGANSDIIVASVQAYLRALNRICALSRRPEEKHEAHAI